MNDGRDPDVPYKLCLTQVARATTFCVQPRTDMTHNIFQVHTTQL